MQKRNLSRSSRRTFLTAGGLSALGLTLPQLLQSRSAEAANPAMAAARTAQRGQAKSCILLFGTGGPSQHETFDPKPDAGSGIAGEFASISTTVPGTRICEHLPMMARQAQRYAIIRSTYHGSGTHGVGVHYNMTGHEPSPRASGEPQLSRQDPPCIGGAIRQLRGDRNGLPGAVHLPARIGDQNNFQWGGQHAGYLGPKFDPLMLIDEKWRPGTLPPGFNPPKDVSRQRFAQRTALLNSLESKRPRPTAGEVDFVRIHHQAASIMDKPTVWEAFLIEKETPATIQRYGDNKFGRSCLVARRLVEAGVGLVTVPWMYLHSTKNFDTHKDHFNLMKDLLLHGLILEHFAGQTLIPIQKMVKMNHLHM